MVMVMLKYVILVMSIITIVVILATYLRKYIFMFLKSLIKIDVLSQIVLIILCTIKIRGYVYSTNYISKLKLVATALESILYILGYLS